MKVRVGFVSNSSSTSFVIYGVIPEIDFSNQKHVIETLENVKKLAEEKISMIEVKGDKREEWEIKYLNGIIQDVDCFIDEIKKGDTECVEDIEDLVFYRSACEILGLDSYRNPFIGTNYIGRDLTKIKENQTRKEFEEETKEIIRKIFPNTKDDEFEMLVDAWEDR